MTKLSLFCVILYIVSILPAFANDEQLITWTTIRDINSLNEFIVQSIERRKKVVLFFSADWDTNSRKIAKYIWVPRESLEDYEFVKVDFSGSNETKEISVQYNLEQRWFIPTLVILNANGVEKPETRINGSKITSQLLFLTWLKYGSLNFNKDRAVKIDFVDSKGRPVDELIDSNFAISINSENEKLSFEFKISSNHYIYKNKLKAMINGRKLPRDAMHISGDEIKIIDDAFGEQKIFKKTLKVDVNISGSENIVCSDQNENEFKLIFQGATTNGVIYPPQSRAFNLRVSC